MAIEVQLCSLGGFRGTVYIDSDDTLDELKAAVEDEIGIPATAQRLFLGLEELRDSTGDLQNLDWGDVVTLQVLQRSPEVAQWLMEVKMVRDPSAWLRQSPPSAQCEREVVLAAVAKNGEALQYAAAELRADREIVATAVARDWRALRWASDELRADRSVVLGAISRNGIALEHAADELRADRDFVLEAVATHGEALEYAAEALRADREVVLAAVAVNGKALNFASAELKADREVAIEAVANVRRAIVYAAQELQGDAEVRSAAWRRWEENHERRHKWL